MENDFGFKNLDILALSNDGVVSLPQRVSLYAKS